MEKIKCICVLRELFKALSELEACLVEAHGMSPNEAVVLCGIGNKIVPAGTVVERTKVKFLNSRFRYSRIMWCRNTIRRFSWYWV